MLIKGERKNVHNLFSNIVRYRAKMIFAVRLDFDSPVVETLLKFTCLTIFDKSCKDENYLWMHSNVIVCPNLDPKDQNDGLYLGARWYFEGTETQ